MIKIVYISFILFVYSCSNLNINYSYFDYFSENFKKENINLEDSYFSDLKSSYVHIIHNNNQAVFVLSSIDNSNFYKWVGPNLEFIKTYRGMIVELSGLDFDYNISNYSLLALKNNHLESDLSFNINISTPELRHFPIDNQLFKKIKTKDCETYITYKKSSIELNFKSYETYCIQNSKVVSSIQKLSPIHSGFELNFVYK